MRWQKIARIALALFMVGFAGWVIVALRRPGATPRPPETLAIDSKPIAQTLGGFEWKREKGGKVLFSIKSETHKVYEDGRNLFERATLELPDRDGRTIIITADEAEASKPAGTTDVADSDFLLRGHVRLRTSDDLNVTANDASFKAKDGLLNVPGPVTFTRGRMTGKGVGATYDRGRDVLWILADAQIDTAPDASGGGALHATAGTAGLARADHYVRLSKAAHVVADNRTIDADDLTATLTPDDQKIQGMQLRGNSRIVGSGAGARSMSATDIDLTYAADGRTLQSAKLMEQSEVQLPAEGGGGSRRITARMIDMTMSADGSAVTALNATENVVLELPGQGTAPGKTIKAATLVASGAGNAGLQTATFEGPVDYRETRAARGGAAAVDRHVTSRRLIVQTKPGLGDLQQAEFRGNVLFVDGTRTTAEAQVGLYQVAQDRLDLSSSNDPGPPPTVVNGQMTVHARTIGVTISTQVLKADTDVRSIMDRRARPAGRGDAGRGPEAATRLPSLLKQDQPVTIRSNRLESDGVSARAVYSGAARLTQPGGTELSADTIELDDKSGNLTARVNVHTKMNLEDVDPKTTRRRSTTMTGSAETFVYDDAKRLATYASPGPPLAHIVGPQGDVTARQIELFLKPGANELDRAEAEGDVTTIEGNRVAKGRHLTYTAADGTYLMTGTPVEVVEKEQKDPKQPPSCKKTLTGTLSFQRAIDGFSTEGIPVTTVPVACPGTPK